MLRVLVRDPVRNLYPKGESNSGREGWDRTRKQLISLISQPYNNINLLDSLRHRQTTDRRIGVLELSVPVLREQT